MVFKSWFTLVVCALLYAGSVAGLVVNLTTTLYEQPSEQNVLTPAIPAAPRFVVYSDQSTSFQGPPPPKAITGFNVFSISFLLLSGPADQADIWASLSSSERSRIKSQYAAAGISLIVSAFGETDSPTSNGADPLETANMFADWVRKYNLDGIDVDYEDFNAFDAGTAEAWLIKFTHQLRAKLPAGSFILSHAPVAPWFSPGLYSGGGYLRIHKTVGNLIDWYNIQFYNQGKREYITCPGLLTGSSSTWPQTSVFEIADSGVPMSKIVIGKPATSGDASDGYVPPATLAKCLRDGKGQGWNGGAMVWEYPNAASAWIKTVRSLSWPL